MRNTTGLMRRGAAGIAVCALITLPSSGRSQQAQPVITEFGPTFRSQLGGIMVAADGTVWAEQQDGAARLSRSGAIVQIRRSDDGSHNWPTTIGLGPDGAVWTNGGDRLLRFAGTSVRSYNVASHPFANVAFLPNSIGLYVARQSSFSTLRIDDQFNHYTVVPTLGPNYFGFPVMASDSKGNFWVSAGSTLLRYDHGSLSGDLAADYVSTHTLETLATTANGDLIADSAGPGTSTAATVTFVRISAQGTVHEIARVPDRARDTWLIGAIAVGRDDSIWFTEPSMNRVGHILPDGTVQQYRDGIPTSARPAGIAVDKDGSVWFTDSARATIEHLTPDGHVQVIGNGLPPTNTPGGPVVTSDGAVWFRETHPWRPRIARIAPSGAITEFRDPAAGINGTLPRVAGTLQVMGNSVIEVGGIDPPNVFAIDPAGGVRSFDASGCFVAQAGIACFPNRHALGVMQDPDNAAGSVVRGPDGNVWFTDAVHSRIVRVSSDGRFSYFSQGLTRWHSGPQYITVGPDGALWFTEMRDRVGRITMDGRITEYGAGIPFRAFPGGIVAGRDGNLWFTLYHGNELARITLAGTVTRFRKGIYPSRGDDSNVVDSIPSTDREGHIWFNESQGGRIARATIP
jgi:streptogramin lyase